MTLETSNTASFDDEIRNHLRAMNIEECELGTITVRSDIYKREIFKELRGLLRRDISISRREKTPMFWYGLAEIDLLFSFLPLSIKFKSTLKIVAKNYYKNLMENQVKRVSIERVAASCVNLSYSTFDYHYENQIAFLEELDERKLKTDSSHFANRLNISYIREASMEIIESLFIDLSIPKTERDIFKMILNDERKRKGKNLSEKEIKALAAAFAFHIRKKQGIRVTTNKVAKIVGLHHKTVQERIYYLTRYRI